MKILVSEKKLLPEYVPERIPHREKEFEVLLNEFSGLCKHGIAGQAALITGKVGVGKTMLAKKVSLKVKECANLNGIKIKSAYVNARIARSPLTIISWIVEELGNAFPKRGYDFSEALMYVSQTLASNETRMFLIIDEIDYPLLIEDNKSLSEFMYALIRLGELTETPFSMIIISKSLSYLSKLDSSTRSYMERMILKLKPYSEDQLYDILKARVDEALISGSINEEPLRLIASFSARYGDARLALEILYRAFKIAEHESSYTVLARHVREAIGSLPLTSELPDFTQLSSDEKIVLSAIVKALKATGAAMVSMGEARYHYELMASSSRNQKPMSYTKFWMIVRTLATKGYITISVSGKRKRGRTTLIGIPSGQLDIWESVMASPNGKLP